MSNEAKEANDALNKAAGKETVEQGGASRKPADLDRDDLPFRRCRYRRQGCADLRRGLRLGDGSGAGAFDGGAGQAGEVVAARLVRGRGALHGPRP